MGVKSPFHSLTGLLSANALWMLIATGAFRPVASFSLRLSAALSLYNSLQESLGMSDQAGKNTGRAISDLSQSAKSAFGLGMAALIMTIFGFVWLGWGFSVSGALQCTRSSAPQVSRRGCCELCQKWRNIPMALIYLVWGLSVIADCVAYPRLCEETTTRQP